MRLNCDFCSNETEKLYAMPVSNITVYLCHNCFKMQERKHFKFGVVKLE